MQQLCDFFLIMKNSNIQNMVILFKQLVIILSFKSLQITVKRMSQTPSLEDLAQWFQSLRPE